MRLMVSALDRMLQGLRQNTPSGRRRIARQMMQASVERLEPRQFMTAATIIDVNSAKSPGTYHTGNIDIKVVFSAPITSVSEGAIPILFLNSGGVAQGVSFSGKTLTFTYAIGNGQWSGDLDYTSTGALCLARNEQIDLIDLNAHIYCGDQAVLTLPATGSLHSLAGNEALVVDSVAPNALVTGVSPGSPHGIGNFDTNRTSGILTFSGTGEAGGIVTLKRGTVSKTGTVTSSGTWTIDFTSSTWTGCNAFSMSETDVAGNISPTATFTVTVDTAPPVFSGCEPDTYWPTATSVTSGTSKSTAWGSLFFTAGQNVSISGTAEPGITITLTNTINGNTSSAVVDATGKWTVDFTAYSLASGTNYLTMDQRDAAGNADNMETPVNIRIDVNTSTYYSTLSTQLADPDPNQPFGGAPHGHANKWYSGVVVGNVIAGDFNGDGKQDLAGTDASGQWAVGISDGEGFVTSPWGSVGLTPVAVFTADFNGDGRSDVLAVGADGVAPRIGISTGTSFSMSTVSALQNKVIQGVGDFDGDGRADVLAVDTASGNAWVVYFAGSASTQTASAWSFTPTNLLIGDFTGDGRDDIAGQDASGNWVIGSLAGASFSPLNWGNPQTGWTDVHAADFTGDHIADIVGRQAVSGIWTILASNGSAFGSSYFPTLSGNYSNVVIADMNGDGCADIIGKVGANNDWKVAFSQVSAGMLSGFSETTWVAAGPSSLIIANFADAVHTTLSAFQNIYNTIAYEPYYGARKGAKATEATKAGNDWDQAALLMSKLPAGVSGRYLYDDVTDWDWTEVANWLGVQSTQSAFTMLANADLLTGDLLNGWAIHHAWLRVYTAGPNGFAWYDLDPSWKFQKLSTNSFDALTSVPYQPINSNGSINGAGYLGQVSASDMGLPADWYADQVQGYLGSNSLGLSTADIGCRGTIIGKQFDALPSRENLPFSYEDQSVQNGWEIPDVKKQRIQLTLNLDDGGYFGHYWVLLPDVGPGTIVMDSVGTGNTVSLRILVNGEDVTPNFTDFSATLSLDTYAFHIWDKVTLGVTNVRIDADSSGDAIYSATFSGCSVTSVIGIGLDAGQWSDAALLDEQARLNDLALGAASGTVDPRVYQDEMLGFGAMKYFHDLHVQSDEVTRLCGFVPLHPAVGTGIMYSPTIGKDPTLGQNGTLNGQYPLFSNVLTDNPLNIVGFAARSGLTDYASGNGFQLFNLLLDNGSALEHDELEQLMNREAISTMKGFALAKQHGATFLKVSAADPNGTSSIDSCTALYQWQRKALIADHNAGYDLYFPNMRVTVPDNSTLPYPPPDAIPYTWTGAVWIRSKAVSTPTGSSNSRGYMIMGDGEGQAHGGAGGGLAANSYTRTPVVIQQEPYRTLINDPVDPYNGSLYHDELDFSIPNTGIPFDFSRHYDTLLTSVPNVAAVGAAAIDVGMGLGWTFTFSDFIEKTSAGVFIWNTGKGQRWDLDYDSTTVTFDLPAGMQGTFSKVDTYKYSYTTLDGVVYTFQQGADIPTLTAASTFYRLTGIQDRNGNVLSLNYDVNTTSRLRLQNISDVTNGTNNAVTLASFTWNATGYHITQVSDIAGRTWSYQYESLANGCQSAATVLTQVSAPAYGANWWEFRKVQYTYNSSPQLFGLMSSLRDWITRSPIFAPSSADTYTYQYYPNRRLFAVVDPKGGEQRYSYDLRHNRTVYTDERGNSSTLYFNTNGLLEKYVEADSSRTANIWDADRNLLVATTDALGRTESYSYAQNLIGAISYSTPQGDNPGEHAFDGDYSTFYHSDAEENGWVKVDLGQSYRISDIQYAPSSPLKNA